MQVLTNGKRDKMRSDAPGRGKIKKDAGKRTFLCRKNILFAAVRGGALRYWEEGGGLTCSKAVAMREGGGA